MRKGILAGYFLGGYPDIPVSLEIMKKSAPEVDVFEIGYPAEDPFLEGETIRQAHKKALVPGDAPGIGYWETLRDALDKPVWIMAYRETFIRTGRYREFAERTLADALVLPDCTDAERFALQEELLPQGMEVLGFANHETPPEQFVRIASRHRTIYFQLYLGKTGSTDTKDRDPSAYIDAVKTLPGVTLVAGFGINSAERARYLIDRGFDGVVIGTALVKALNESEKTMLALIRDISRVLAGERP
ncbi:MAG: tryptophan synthase subunit alpha [Treponema sp.]|jgi:tryptophan synthase alpha chain|nr:tryptophan synthase subunit alpha [Treponema sp.]